MIGDTKAHGRPRVAVVDDEPDVLTFVRLALDDRGFDVMTLDRVAGALSALRAFAPDAICLDLLMPEQTGLSLLVEIRKDPDLAQIPVLILSALNAREEAPRGASARRTRPGACRLHREAAEPGRAGGCPAREPGDRGGRRTMTTTVRQQALLRAGLFDDIPNSHRDHRPDAAGRRSQSRLRAAARRGAWTAVLSSPQEPQHALQGLPGATRLRGGPALRAGDDRKREAGPLFTPPAAAHPAPGERMGR